MGLRWGASQGASEEERTVAAPASINDDEK